VRALAAAATVAHAAAVLSRTDPPLNPGRFLYQLIDHSQRAEDFIVETFGSAVESDPDRRRQFSRALGQLDGLWKVNLIEAVDRIGQFATEKSLDRVRRGNAGLCLCSVPTSFLYLLRRPDSFRDAVVAAVNGGGDTDTIGAMTGAMAGSLHGAEAIPAEWLAALSSRDLLEQVAAALADPGAPRDPLPDLYEAELPLTLETSRYQLELMDALARRLHGSDAQT
jgi:hypothetical protein